MSSKKMNKMASSLLDSGPTVLNEDIGEVIEDVKPESEAKLPDLPIEPAFEGSLHIPLVHIHHFENNPRLQENPEYEAIKESIAQKGLTQTLQVTKRPQDDFYVLRSGGNTRLKALNALYDEAVAQGDKEGMKKYGLVQVMYHPYTNEIDMLAMHVEENNVRGAMHFIDNAIAFDEAIKLIESERKSKMGESYAPLAMSAIADELKAKGFSITRQRLSAFAFANEIKDYFPKAFASNMGRPMVETIRREINVLKEWIAAKNYKEIEADTVEQFLKILKQFDQEDMNASKFDDIYVDAIAALGDEIGEQNIVTEIRNLRKYKNINGPIGGTEEVEAEEALVDSVPNENSTAPVGRDEESSATLPIEKDSATAPIEKDSAAVPEIDSEPVISKKALIDTLKDFIAGSPLAQLFFAEDLNLETKLESGADLDSDEIPVVGSIAFNVNSISMSDFTNVHAAIEESEYGDLITTLLVIKHLLMLMVKVNDGKNSQAANMLMSWYIRDRNNLFNQSVFGNVLDVSEVLDSAVTVLNKNGLADMNQSVLDLLYADHFNEYGMDVLDFKEFVAEYLRIKTTIANLP